MNYRYKQYQQLVNWSQAYNHAQANRVARPLQSNHLLNNINNKCRCCQQIIDKENISLCQNTKQLAIFGCGYPLYFTIIKYCILYLLILSIANGISSINVALNNNYDFMFNGVKRITIDSQGIPIECSSILVGLARIQNNVNRDQIILRVCTFCILLILWIFIRYRITTQITIVKQNNQSFKNYSILINNMPKKTKSKTAIASLLSNYQISSLIPIYSYSHIVLAHQQILQLQSQKRLCIHSLKQMNDVKEDCFISTQIRIHELQQQIIKLKRTFVKIVEEQIRLYYNDEVKTQGIIVCFQSIEEKQTFLRKWKQQPELFIFPEDWDIKQIMDLQMSEIPDPKQLIWSNSNKTLTYFKYQLLNLFILLFIIIVFSTIYYFNIKYISESLKDNTITKKYAYVLFFIICSLIIVINHYILKAALRRLQISEYYIDKQSQTLDFIVKYLLGLLSINILLLFSIHGLILKNWLANNLGYIESQSSLIIFVAYCIPLLYLFNPLLLINYLKQKYYQNKQLLINQIQANKIMQMMPHQTGERYSQIINLIWLISFTQSLIPLGSIVGLFGLILFYWVDKYNFLRRSTLKQNKQVDVTMKIVNLLQFSIVLMPAGELIFDQMIRQTYHLNSLICVAIGILYICFNKKIVNLIKSHQITIKQKKGLTENIPLLGSNYEYYHPIIGQQMKSNLIKMKKQLQTLNKIQSYENNINIQMNKSILEQSCFMQPELLGSKLKKLKEQSYRNRIRIETFENQLLNGHNYHSPFNI